MALPYDHTQIEARWQRRWADDRLHEVDLDGTDPARALYNLVEFPYPSADGLHIGHALTYSRRRRLGPVPAHARAAPCSSRSASTRFGINAENFALRGRRAPARR